MSNWIDYKLDVLAGSPAVLHWFKAKVNAARTSGLQFFVIAGVSDCSIRINSCDSHQN